MVIIFFNSPNSTPYILSLKKACNICINYACWSTVKESLCTLVCLRIYKHNSTTANKIAVNKTSYLRENSPRPSISEKVTELAELQELIAYNRRESPAPPPESHTVGRVAASQRRGQRDGFPTQLGPT